MAYRLSDALVGGCRKGRRLADLVGAAVAIRCANVAVAVAEFPVVEVSA